MRRLGLQGKKSLRQFPLAGQAGEGEGGVLEHDFSETCWCFQQVILERLVITRQIAQRNSVGAVYPRIGSVKGRIGKQVALSHLRKIMARSTRGRGA